MPLLKNPLLSLVFIIFSLVFLSCSSEFPGHRHILLESASTGRLPWKGNPQSRHSYKSDTIALFHGKAMLVVGSTREEGVINIEINSAGKTTLETIKTKR